MSPTTYNNMISKLPAADRKAVGVLEKKMRDSQEFVSKTCDFLLGKIGKDAVKHFKSMSEENKVEACVGHITIGMLSGDIRRRDIEKIV